MQNNKNISISLPKHMIERLDDYGNRSKTVQDALTNFFLSMPKTGKDLSFTERVRKVQKSLKDAGVKPVGIEKMIELKNKGRKYESSN